MMTCTVGGATGMQVSEMGFKYVHCFKAEQVLCQGAKKTDLERALFTGCNCDLQQTWFPLVPKNFSQA